MWEVRYKLFVYISVMKKLARRKTTCLQKKRRKKLHRRRDWDLPRTIYPSSKQKVRPNSFVQNIWCSNYGCTCTLNGRKTWLLESQIIQYSHRREWSHWQHSLSTVTGSFQGKAVTDYQDSLTTNSRCREFPWTRAIRSLYSTIHMHLHVYIYIFFLSYYNYCIHTTFIDINHQV